MSSFPDRKKIHVIVNSHMDPVWLWNRSSGRRAWSNVVASVLRMMRRHDNITFTCSASTLYRWIEETDPKMFADIQSLVREGRWELIGGWEVQSDAIVASAESIRLQGKFGRRYFQEKFGVDVHIGYCVDSFGHNAGLPKLLRETGFDAYLFMRGGNNPPPLFRWQSPDGIGVTAMHIPTYTQVPTVTREQLSGEMQNCEKNNPDGGLFFFGVGDHGGVASERMLNWMDELMKDSRFEFSTVEKYLALHQDDPMPVITGSLDHCFPGCYSVNHAVKQRVANTGDLLMQAEAFGSSEEQLELPRREWLFCHFHDSLPGTCIREAYERDVYPALDGAASAAIEMTDKALARRAAAFDTSFMTEGGLYAYNPFPDDLRFPVSYPAFTDPNVSGSDFDSLTDGAGKVIPLQAIPADSSFGPCGMRWGKLTAVLDLAAGTENGYAYTRCGKFFPKVGFARSEELLKQLSFAVYHDDFRTWGFDLVRFEGHFDLLRPEQVIRLADGPVISILRVVYLYRSSRITLDICTYAGIDNLKIEIAANWQEHRTALKLVRDTGLESRNFIHGGMDTWETKSMEPTWTTYYWKNGDMAQMDRATDELPMIDFCAVTDGKRLSGLFSGDLHGVDCIGASVRPTLLRCVPYADHKPWQANEDTGFIDEGRSTYTLWSLDESSCDPALLLRKAKMLHQLPGCCEVSPR